MAFGGDGGSGGEGSDGSGGGGTGDASPSRAGEGWTILDGGVTAETSVTEKPEYDAFDDMDWG